MKRNGISQEGLKLLACISMLVDHIGAALLPDVIALRILGRLAFPLYCFLLAQGVRHTSDPVRYGLRLLIAMVVAELPFDLLFSGGFTWQRQSVMVTLVLIYLMAMVMCNTKNTFFRLLTAFACAAAGEFLRCDYGGLGVLMGALFLVTNDMALQLCGIIAISYLMPSAAWMGIPIQAFSAAALLPMALYQGGKHTGSKALQYAFYGFYPAHMMILWLISR